VIIARTKANSGCSKLDETQIQEYEPDLNTGASVPVTLCLFVGEQGREAVSKKKKSYEDLQQL